MNYFTKKELRCKCGCKKAEMKEDFMLRANQARHISGVPFIVTSAYRCKEHNKAVGGRGSSSHLKGLALDISIKSPQDALKIIDGLLQAGIKRILPYVVKGKGKNMDMVHIHFDDDGEKESTFRIRRY